VLCFCVQHNEHVSKWPGLNCGQRISRLTDFYLLFFNLKIELKAVEYELKPVEYLVFIHKILNLSFESKNDKRAPRGKGKSSCYNVG
jgi:hypothetical protein